MTGWAGVCDRSAVTNLKTARASGKITRLAAIRGGVTGAALIHLLPGCWANEVRDVRKETILALGMAGCIACSSVGATPATPDAQAMEEGLAALETMAGPADQFVDKCVSHVFSGNDLNARTSGNPAFLEYTPEQAARFLLGQPGKAWGFHTKSENYVVTLLDNGICRLFAQTADAATAHQDLDTMVKGLTPGFPVRSITGTRAGPQTDAFVSSGRYAVLPHNKNRTPLFFVTTSTSPTRYFDAMYWMTFGDPDAMLPDKSEQGEESTSGK